MSTFHIRPTRLEDLPKINALLERVKFDVGVHILEIYFKYSNRLWQVAVDENEQIVAFDSAHELAFAGELKGLQFGYDMYVRDDFQNRGIVKKFATVYGTKPMIGNATPQSLIQIKLFESFDTKLLGYCGVPILDGLLDSDLKEYDSIRIHALDDHRDMNQLLIYDRSIHDCDRTQFMREWCSTSKPDRPYARTLIARSSTRKIVGFGTIRRFSDFFSLMPLYADDEFVARRLLNELTRTFIQDRPNDHLYVFFDAKNHLLMEFVHGMNLEQCDSEVREYSRGAKGAKKYMRFDKVYTFLDYWPV